MSHVMCSLCRVLKIRHLHITIYYPQMNRFVERFNSILKNLLCQCVQEELCKWDLLESSLLFVMREAPQSPLGFAPFELLHGHHTRSLLDIV